jgi:teichuronic acid biosynthesis glycosyltransferase TuaC
VLNGALTWERRSPDSDVLVVTNMWPDAERPVYGIFVKRQVDSLLRRGFRCDVLYLRGYRSPFVYLWAALWFLGSGVRLRRRYRLIHAHAGETGVVARFQLGTPLLISYCGDDLLGDPAKRGGMTAQSRLRAYVIRHHSRLLAATITKSAEMERALPSSVRKSNLVLPNGVDTGLFVPIPQREARRELGWDDGELVTLFAATRPWIPRKRHWLAEAACREASEELGQHVRLEVAAEVPPERMPLLMNASDCLLMTSSIEGSPNTVKEALMCNLPVVATPSGDVAILLRGVEPSFLCPPDPVALGRALARCLTGRRRSNGREAAAWLSDEAIARRLIERYRSLAPVSTRDPCRATEPAPKGVSA